jgi:hypothetical protein
MTIATYLAEFLRRLLAGRLFNALYNLQVTSLGVESVLSLSTWYLNLVR